MAKSKKPARRIEPVFDISGNSRGAPHVRADILEIRQPKSVVHRAKKLRSRVDLFRALSVRVFIGRWLQAFGFLLQDLR